MTMDVKGITWVGNIYQKFENMCLEAEEVMLEETVKYIENQMQTVGESVKKIYSEVMQDLLPPPSCDLDEKVASKLPIEQYADNGLCEKTFQGCEEITVKADTKEAAKDSRVNHDVSNNAIHDESCYADGNYSRSHARQCIEDAGIESNLGSDENQQNIEIPVSKPVTEITSLESDTCSTSQSCEVSNENQNQEVTLSKPAFAAEAYCCEEIENASSEQISNVLLYYKPAEYKEMNMSYSSSSVIFGDTDEIPEGWSLDATMVDTVIDHGHTTMQHDDELKLEETCVLVTRDELQLVPKMDSNAETKKCPKKKRRQPFSLSKKSGRKQEYKELALWHGNKEKGKGDSVENFCPTSVEDQNKLLLPDLSEPDWELL